MIRVVVVDDHPAVRLGLADFLDAQDGIEIVGQAENGAQAVELSRSTDPDVVVMDIRMPELDGIEATRLIKRTASGDRRSAPHRVRGGRARGCRSCSGCRRVLPQGHLRCRARRSRARGQCGVSASSARLSPRAVALWLVGWIGTLAGIDGASPRRERRLDLGRRLRAALRDSPPRLEPSERRARKSFAFFGAGMLAWALGQAGLDGVRAPGSHRPVPLPVGRRLPRRDAVPRRRRADLASQAQGLDGRGLLDGALALAPSQWSRSASSLRADPRDRRRRAPRRGSGSSTRPRELALVAIIGAGLLFNGWADRGRVALIGLGLLSLAVADTRLRDRRARRLAHAHSSNGGWTLAFAAMGAASLLPRGWPAEASGRVPEFLPAIVVTVPPRPRRSALCDSRARPAGLAGMPTLVDGLPARARRDPSSSSSRACSRDRTRELVADAGGAARSAAHARPLPRRARQRAGARRTGHRRHPPRRRRAAADGARLPARARSAEDGSSQAPRAHARHRQDHRVDPRSPRRAAPGDPRRPRARPGDRRRRGRAPRPWDRRPRHAVSAPHPARDRDARLPTRPGSARERAHRPAGTLRGGRARACTTGRSTAASAPPAAASSPTTTPRTASASSSRASGPSLQAAASCSNATPGRGTDIVFELPIPVPLSAAVEAAS